MTITAERTSTVAPTVAQRLNAIRAQLASLRQHLADTAPDGHQPNPLLTTNLDLAAFALDCAHETADAGDLYRTDEDIEWGRLLSDAAKAQVRSDLYAVPAATLAAHGIEI